MAYYKNLLLIDDDQDDHEFFLEALREIDASINCICLFDGEQALGMLRERNGVTPDLIVLDTNMPRINGKQVLAELKRDPELRTIPVIMYSTFISDKDNEELLRLGAVNYLAKPSKFEEFLNSLNEILRRRW